MEPVKLKNGLLTRLGNELSKKGVNLIPLSIGTGEPGTFCYSIDIEPRMPANALEDMIEELTGLIPGFSYSVCGGTLDGELVGDYLLEVHNDNPNTWTDDIITLTSDDNGSEITIKSKALVIVVGTVKLKSIYVKTDEIITFYGDTLVVENTEPQQPCIGVKTNNGMSFGRWSINSYNKCNLTFNLKRLYTVSKVPGFSIGTYGKLMDKKSVLFNCETLSIPDEHTCYVDLPGRVNGSTKMGLDAVYMSNVEYLRYLFEKEEKANLLKSDFKSDDFKVKEMLNFLTVESNYNFNKINNFVELGKFVGNMSVCADNYIEELSKYSTAEIRVKLFTELIKNELLIMKEAGIYFKCPLSLRSFICLEDSLINYFFDKGKYLMTRGNFLDELNLSEEMHNRYFPDLSMRQYKVCERYVYGSSVIKPTTNEEVNSAPEVHTNFVAYNELWEQALATGSNLELGKEIKTPDSMNSFS